MSLSNIVGWSEENSATCGTACGADDKSNKKPAACGTACGAGDKSDK